MCRTSCAAPASKSRRRDRTGTGTVPLEDGRLRGATISVRAGDAHDTGGVTGGAITAPSV